MAGIAYQHSCTSEAGRLASPGASVQMLVTKCQHTSSEDLHHPHNHPHNHPPTPAAPWQVVIANPKTAGVARWIFLALWGVRMAKGDAAAIQFVTKVFENVVVQPRDAREASDVFYRQKIGEGPGRGAAAARRGCVSSWFGMLPLADAVPGSYRMAAAQGRSDAMVHGYAWTCTPGMLLPSGR